MRDLVMKDIAHVSKMLHSSFNCYKEEEGVLFVTQTLWKKRLDLGPFAQYVRNMTAFKTLVWYEKRIQRIQFKN